MMKQNNNQRQPQRRVIRHAQKQGLVCPRCGRAVEVSRDGVVYTLDANGNRYGKHPHQNLR